MIVRSPLAGWCSSLEEAPDEVFSGRLLGDGVLIDPTGHELFAPCDGEIISIASSKHAIAMRTPEGAEVLMHVGIDTVNLAGKGFDVHVTTGTRVATGTKLMTFDLDFLARNAKSLATPIIITNSEQIAILHRQIDRELAVGDEVFSIQTKRSAHAARAPDDEIWSETMRIDHGHGIHARPGALIANAARKFPSTAVEIVAHGRQANAASAVAMMSLGVRARDEILIRAAGPHARAAVDAIKKIIEALPVHHEHESREAGLELAPSGDPNRLRGVIASRGVAVGQVFHLRRSEVSIREQGGSIAHERAELVRAMSEVRGSLKLLAISSAPSSREVLEAHLELLDDPAIAEVAQRSIAAGKSAAYAWRQAIRSFADAFKAIGDARMAERVDDLLDLEHQVIAALMNIDPKARVQLPQNSVLVATDLQPSQFVALDKSSLVAVCLAAGGPTSHVAILAAATGIPMLVALGDGLATAKNGDSLIVDAEQGILHLAPNEHDLAETSKIVVARQREMETQRANAQRESRTADGVRIEVFANLGSLDDARLAVSQGAEGCGLLRTEFLFLEREQAPNEQEQLRCYQEIADELAGRPVIIRTLDIGGDKPIAYLPMPAEENPALGLRGIRTSLWQPDLLRTQLRAILGVQPRGLCRVLLPMVTEVEEILTVRRLLEQQSSDLGFQAATRIGIMIETPASAVLADQLAPAVDFFSIGTNDLTQYTLAMDRGHAELAPRLDGLHPAVLRLIAQTCDAAAKHQRLVAVCGSLASDPTAVPVLIGLGVGELSCVPAVIPRIKHLVASVTLADCTALAKRALSLDSAQAVRALVSNTATESFATIRHCASTH